MNFAEGSLSSGIHGIEARCHRRLDLRTACAEASDKPYGRSPAAALTCSDVATIRAGLPEKWGFCWGVIQALPLFLTYGKQKQFASLSLRTERPRDLNGDIRETHVSAEPPCSQAPPRLPQAHADRRRSKGSCTPPVQGPQAPLGVNRAKARVAVNSRGRRQLFRSCQPSRRVPNFSRYAAGAVRRPLHSLLKCGSGR